MQDDAPILDRLVWDGSDFVMSGRGKLVSDHCIAIARYYESLVEQKGTRPRWSDIKPDRIRSQLPHIFLIEAPQDSLDDPDAYYFRMFGSGMARRFGMELFHKRLSAVPQPLRREMLRRLTAAEMRADAMTFSRGKMRSINDFLIWTEGISAPLEPERPGTFVVFGAIVIKQLYPLSIDPLQSKVNNPAKIADMA